MYRIMPLKVAEISVPLGAVVMMGDMRVMTTGSVYVSGLLTAGMRK